MTPLAWLVLHLGIVLFDPPPGSYVSAERLAHELGAALRCDLVAVDEALRDRWLPPPANPRRHWIEIGFERLDGRAVLKVYLWRGTLAQLAAGPEELVRGEDLPETAVCARRAVRRR